ncbi:MAG: NUDIX domain-containing protein [Thermomicrobiales bacterium]
MNFRFCPRCATPLVTGEIAGRQRQYCPHPGCGFVYYQNPLPIAGCVVEHDGGIVLIRRGVEPRAGSWALPAGYVEADETVEDAARRETREECDLAVTLLELLGVYSFVPPPPRPSGIGLYYLARATSGLLAPGDDATDARVFQCNDLPELAFSSHTQAVAAWLKRQGG